MSADRKLRPTSESEAKEFVRLCLQQGLSREKIAGFLSRLGFDPRLALAGASPESEPIDPSLELEIDEVMLQEAANSDRPQPPAPEKPRSEKRSSSPAADRFAVPSDAPIVLESQHRQPKRAPETKPAHAHHQPATVAPLPREWVQLSPRPKAPPRSRREGSHGLRVVLMVGAFVMITLVVFAWFGEDEHKNEPVALEQVPEPGVPARIAPVVAPAGTSALAVPARVPASRSTSPVRH